MQNKNKMIPMLVSMGLCVAALTSGVAYYSAHRIKGNLPKDTAQAKPQVEMSSPVTAPQTPTLDTAKQEREQKLPKENTDQTQSTPKKATEMPKQTAEKEPANKQADLTFTWPVQGEIVLPYSADQAVYDPTLEQYRTNDTLCIAAPVGTEIAAAADGVVAEITEDTEKGRTLVLEHSNGWRTTYGPLQKDGLPEKGATVKQGQTIGTVDQPTKYQGKLGEHIAFGITQDGQSVDPQSKLQKS